MPFYPGSKQKPSPYERVERGKLKTLSWERVDRAQPGTGVGRDKVGPGTAPLPALRGHLPPGEGLGSYFFVVLLVSSSVLPWIRASIRVREYSIWL